MDAEVVKLPRDADLVLDREVQVFGLSPVAERGIVDEHFLFHNSIFYRIAPAVT